MGLIRLVLCTVPAILLLTSKQCAKAVGYYIMANKLIEDRYIDYEKYIRAIDPSIPHSFLQQIIDHIVVSDGRVTSITFKNGATHTFTYKT